MRNHRSRSPLAILYKSISLVLMFCVLLGGPCLGGIGRVQADELPRSGRTGGTVPITTPTTEPEPDPVAEPTLAPPEEVTPPEETPSEETPSEEVPLSEPAQADPPASQTRFGVATNSNPWDFQYFGALKAGWYHNWDARAWELTAIPDVEYVPMVGAWGDLWGSETEQMLRNYINQCPDCYPDGTVWIIGNEPEFDQFDTINGQAITPRAITPDEYAQKYKKYYDMIKGINPTYKVAVGATYDDSSWPDATRCSFVPKARQAYESRYGEKMPIDAYTLHAYMDQLDAPLFQLETMVQRKRGIMNDYGDRDKPLLVTEVGVLTALRNPVPSTAAINAFMDSAFDYLSTATSEGLGCPGDENRMVQRWAWFALTSRNPSQGDDYWKGTNLLDIQTGNMTSAGQTYAAYPKTPPPLPSGFWGTAKSGGVNVANGTSVTAWIDGVQVAHTTSLTADGKSVYSLDVPGDDPSTPGRDGGNENDTIRFKIGEVWANETATWHSGTTRELNLTVSSTATSFRGAGYWSSKFGVSDGWNSYNTYPRTAVDMNGDGKADLIGFKADGVYVALSTGSGFGAPTRWIANFATNAGGWSSYDRYPRIVADANGDGKADLVAFGQSGTIVALAEGAGVSSTLMAPTVDWMAEEAEARTAWRDAQQSTTSDAWHEEYVVPVLQAESQLVRDVQGVRSDSAQGPKGIGPAQRQLARWTRTLYVAEEGTYEFRLPIDAGARLLVDGYMVLDGQAEMGVLGLGEGLHTIALECQDCTLDAPPDLTWDLLMGASLADMAQ